VTAASFSQAPVLDRGEVDLERATAVWAADHADRVVSVDLLEQADEVLADAGLADHDYTILAILAEDAPASQQELARLLGLPQPKISELERDVRSDMLLSTARRVAQILQMSLDDLAGDETDAEPAPAAGARG
jgi:DNA-binding XRE family transcriptional regulator